jgi:N-acetyl-alpha-D-glucosaminyl L-malate synthase BshA
VDKINAAIFCMGSQGGSTEVAINLALSLRARGHECDIFAYDASQQERLIGNGIRVHTPRSLDYPLFDHIQTDFGFLPAFDKLHKRKPYNLIHVHYAVPLLHVMANLREIYGLPCVVTFHGSDVTIVPDLLDVSILARLLEKSGATVTAASRFLAQRVARVYGVAPGNVHIIPNTIAPEYLQDYPCSGDTPPYFLHCSNLRPVKRAYDVALGMCKLRKMFEARRLTGMPHLKIAGEGPDLPELRVLVQKCGLEEYVEFCGMVSDKTELARLMACAKALILSSLTESQPLVVLEAMAVRTPVVCSNFSSAPELIGDHEERGWTFDIGDAQQLADLLMRLIEKPEEIPPVVERAREFVLSKHHPDQVVSAYLKLYEEILGKG